MYHLVLLLLDCGDGHPATNAVFIDWIINADAAAACGGFKDNKPSLFPKYYFFDPRRARGSMVRSSVVSAPI